MDAEIKRKWVEALRSGKYEQGAGQLRKGQAFCCLGVLCDVAGISIHERGVEAVNAKGDVDGYEPIKALDFGHVETSRLTSMNDEGKSFSEIADYIEEHL